MKKELEYLIAHKNNLWAGVMPLAGGLGGIFLTANYSIPIVSIENIVKMILIAIGGLFLPLMLIGVVNTNLEIQKLLK